jgi:hypothetical protein
VAARAFWLILDGAVPTAFRARRREDLLPTLHQLQRTQPTVALVWFERGRSWDSPAKEAFEVRGRETRGRKRDWRPGGSHVDPRAKYAVSRDEKRARFKKRAIRDRQDEERGAAPGTSDPRRPKRPAGPRGFGRPGQKGPWKPRRGPGGPKGRR